MPLLVLMRVDSNVTSAMIRLSHINDPPFCSRKMSVILSMSVLTVMFERCRSASEESEARKGWWEVLIGRAEVDDEIRKREGTFKGENRFVSFEVVCRVEEKNARCRRDIL